MAPVHQARSPGRLARRGAFFGAATGLALLAFWAAESQGAGAFVARPLDTRIDCSVIARRAGVEEKPGGAPVMEGEEAAPPEEPVDWVKAWASPRKGNISPKIQELIKESRRKLYFKIKGKFTPHGSKPWDPHQFKHVYIQCRLNSKTASNTKLVMQVEEELRRISGKHPRKHKSRIDNNQLGWRRGATCGVGVKITGRLMFDFLHRLNTVILPRVRDFEGLWPNSFNPRGDFSMRFHNQDPFRELDDMMDTRELIHCFDVTIHNNCWTQPEGLKLMKDFGFPFNDEPRPFRAVKVAKYPGQVVSKGKGKKKRQGIKGTGAMKTHRQ